MNFDEVRELTDTYVKEDLFLTGGKIKVGIFWSHVESFRSIWVGLYTLRTGEKGGWHNSDLEFGWRSWKVYYNVKNMW